MKMKIPSKPVVTLSPRVICRGSLSLGTGCMKCVSCLRQWEALYGDKEELELRMYSLVMYNLSPIQQGIQAGHSIVEYSIKQDDMYKNWAKNWKTMIVLNGGTSNSGLTDRRELGSMEDHLNTLKLNGVNVFPFYEPDLNDSLSAMSFVVDERVFNKKKYPDEHQCMLYSNGEPIEPSKEWIENIGGERNYFLRKYLCGFRLA